LAERCSPSTSSKKAVSEKRRVRPDGDRHVRQRHRHRDLPCPRKGLVAADDTRDEISEINVGGVTRVPAHAELCRGGQVVHARRENMGLSQGRRFLGMRRRQRQRAFEHAKRRGHVVFRGLHEAAQTRVQIVHACLPQPQFVDGVVIHERDGVQFVLASVERETARVIVERARIG